MHWYTEPGVALTKFPRSYNIHNSDSLEEFIDDFRITACISILKWLTNTMALNGDQCLVTPQGKVPFSAIDFAVNRLNEYVSFYTHRDIDDTEDQSEHVWEHEWDQFLTHHYLLVHEKAKFVDDKNLSIRYTRLQKVHQHSQRMRVNFLCILLIYCKCKNFFRI